MTSATSITVALRTRNKSGVKALGDRIFRVLLTAIVWTVLAIFAGILVVLIVGAWPAMKRFGPGFIVHTGWDPVHLVFGALPFVVGTIIVAVGAMALATGVGLLTAVCITEVLPPWLQDPIAYLIELLAFIPSVVYGLFGLLVLAPMLQSTVEMWLLTHLGSQLEFFNGSPYGSVI